MKRRRIQISALIILISVLSFVLGESFNKSKNSVDQALNRIASTGALDKSALERAAIEGMLRATGDRWSSYYDSNQSSEESQNLAGRYSGVGIWLRAGLGGGSEISALKKVVMMGIKETIKKIYSKSKLPLLCVKRIKNYN